MRSKRDARKILTDRVLGKRFDFKVTARNTLANPLDTIARTATGATSAAATNRLPRSRHIYRRIKTGIKRATCHSSQGNARQNPAK